MSALTNAANNQLSTRWHYGLVFLVASVLMLWQLGSASLDGHEAYVAMTARNMIDSEHWLDPAVTEGSIPPDTPLNRWLIPVFNGEPRLVKTPLAYWCVTALFRLGLPVNEFTVRFPSAWAGVALAILVLALGRSIFSPRAALMASLMLASSLALISWGRNARPDMQMALWSSVAMACALWAINRPEKPSRHLLLLIGWGALGLANLAKQFVPLFMIFPVGLYLCWRASTAFLDDDSSRGLLIRYFGIAIAGLVVCALVRFIPFLQWWALVDVSEKAGMSMTIAALVGGPATWYAIRTRPWRQIRDVLPTTVPGIILTLSLFIPWMIYIAYVFPQAGGVFARQTTDRALGTDGWLARAATPLTGYYLRAVFKWSLPWVAFLPGALAVPLIRRFREDRNSLIFLILWVFGIVLLFSAFVGKHEQYIIPAMPAVCLLAGYCAEDVFFTHRLFNSRWAAAIVAGYGLVVLVAAVGAGVALTIVDHASKPLAMHVLIIAGLSLVPVWLALPLVGSKPARAVALMVISVFFGEMGFLTMNNPWDLRWENYASLGRWIQKVVPVEDKIFAFNAPDPSLVWYARRDLPAAKKIEARMVRMYGEDEASRLWGKWLKEDQTPWYVVCDRDMDELAKSPLEQVGDAISVGDKGIALFRRRMPLSNQIDPP